MLNISIFIVFLADTPPTPSKKHPYIKMASTKKPKWHLGLFICNILHSLYIVLPIKTQAVFATYMIYYH